MIARAFSDSPSRYRYRPPKISAGVDPGWIQGPWAGPASIAVKARRALARAARLLRRSRPAGAIALPGPKAMPSLRPQDLLLHEHRFRSLGKLVVGNLDRIADVDNVGN